MFLVTGATGDLGRRIIRRLRERDTSVRAFVRLNSRYGELTQRGAETLIGDLRQERDIQRAIQGVQYIISAHSSNSDVQGVDYRANIDLIDAAKASGVQHFVFISVLGSDRGYEDAPIFKAKWEVEKYLQASGLNYTILRPAGLASSLLPLAERFSQTGIYLLVGDAKTRTSVVSSDDLARIAIESPFLEAAKNQTFAIGGPDILQREDIPRIFGRIFNRDPIVLNPPILAFDLLRTGVGFLNSQANENLGTLRALLANEYFCTPEEVQQIERTYGLTLESLESFLRRYLTE